MNEKIIKLQAVGSIPEGKEAIQAFVKEITDLFAGESKNLELTGIAYNKRAAIRQIENSPPDVLLIDLMLPGMRSIDVISYVSGTLPDVKILAMTPGDPPHDRVMLAIQAGARGYISKDATPAELHDVIKKILAGEIYLPIEETFDVLQQAAPELIVSTKERRARFFQGMVGLIPIAGIMSALTEFLWREYWGQAGVRVSDLGVDASSRVTEFLITLMVFLGILGPLLFIPTWIEMIKAWIDNHPKIKEKIFSKVSTNRPGGLSIVRFFLNPWVQWPILAVVLLTVTIPIDISGGKILTIMMGAMISGILGAHLAGLENELPEFLKLSKGKTKQAYIIIGTLLLMFLFLLGAEVFLIGPDLRRDGLHGYLAPKVLDLSAKPAIFYDIDEKHKPLGALYLGGNADLYVLYDPCEKIVRLIPVGSSRVEIVKEVKCPSGEQSVVEGEPK